MRPMPDENPMNVVMQPSRASDGLEVTQSMYHRFSIIWNPPPNTQKTISSENEATKQGISERELRFSSSLSVVDLK